MSIATIQIAKNRGATRPPASPLPTPPSPQQKMWCEFLSAEDYAQWDALVSKSPHGTVFHHAWWLAATGAPFRILVVRDEDGELAGGLPLPGKNARGFTLLHSPKLTPYLGPIFDLSGADGVCEQLHLMRSCGEALARAIGPFDSFRQIAGAAGPDLQGFLWAGFTASLAYTFRFSSKQSVDEISKSMTRTHMQKLTKAKRLNLEMSRHGQVETLIELNRMTFERKGAAIPFDAGLVLRLWEAAHSRGNANLYVATAERVPIAALFTVHDERTTYQIVSGFNPAFPDLPGQSLVLWTALQDAIEAGRNYDFEGSSLRGVETFYRRWGCDAVPVWKIEKTGSVRGALAQLAIRFLDRKRFRTSS
jgi:CelD/BcsL family acetyltransferase involved in cellulose biosynthesis